LQIENIKMKIEKSMVFSAKFAFCTLQFSFFNKIKRFFSKP